LQLDVILTPTRSKNLPQGMPFQVWIDLNQFPKMLFYIAFVSNNRIITDFNYFHYPVKIAVFSN